MSKDGKNRAAFLTALLLGVVVTCAGCEPKGPAEQAGESIDKGVQNAKDAINPPGPLEKAGRGVDKALNR
jgi:hypothetical protein